jgi:hypothetical protein
MIMLRSLAVGCVAMLVGSSGRGGESYFYHGTHGFEASFSLIGGQYDLYVYAKRPIDNSPAAKSCIFSGVFERVAPTPDVVSLGAGLTIGSIVPHKIGPMSVTLPPGQYRLYIPVLVDCDWKFVLNSSAQDPAGVAPVVMLRYTKSGRVVAATASLDETVQFYAQFRTEHARPQGVAGSLQIIHDGRVEYTFPLIVEHDDVSGADVAHQDIKWDSSGAKCLGKNTVKFILKTGADELTSTGDFVLIAASPGPSP